MALTLIDAMSTLAVMGQAVNFEAGLWWLVDNLRIGQHVRVNVFEVNIRVLGGLLSSHLLALDPELILLQRPRKQHQKEYTGQLLTHARHLADRMLPACVESDTGLPYAWINLQHGLLADDSTETNTAAAGSFTLELGLLSRLTGDPKYEDAAVTSLVALWRMRTHLSLFGTSINITTAQWVHSNGGTGAGADSFFEYLLKAYILFGDVGYWHMFAEAYVSVMQHFRGGGWYHDADIFTGQPTHIQFQSLQSFWPGMQVLAGDVNQAELTFWNYFRVWQGFSLMPERFLYGANQLHPTEQYFPPKPSCGLAYNVRWTVGSETVFKGVKECW